MFPPIFAQNAGSMAPSGQGGGTVRLVYSRWNGTEINAGVAKDVPGCPAVPGFYWSPVAWSSNKNIVIAHAPTNATFNLRYEGSATNIMGGITPQVTTVGSRVDIGVDIGASFTPETGALNRRLQVAPSAGNGAGDPSNEIVFAILVALVKGRP
jgi:hypothetical protein